MIQLGIRSRTKKSHSQCC